MSTSLNKTEVAAPAVTEYRIPRVNLLPPEIREAREFKKTQGVLAGALVGVIALIGVGFGLSVWDLNRAENDLAAEQATTAQLNTEKAKYARVTEVKNEADAVNTARQTSMTQDVLWTQQVDQIVTEMPADMTFAKLTMTFDATGGSVDLNNPLANPSGVGTITVDALGKNHTTAAAWLEAEAAHPGYVTPYLTSSEYTDENGNILTKYTTTMRFTPDVFSGRYQPGGSKSVQTGKAN